MTVDDRWKHPDACDLCGKVTANPTWEHIFPPDFTFVWCEECEKDRDEWRHETKSAAGVREVHTSVGPELQDYNRGGSCFGWFFDWIKSR